MTQNHKPNLEQQRGAARLAQEQLYWEAGVAYLPTQPHDGQQVQRLALSRALGDFDLTGKDTTFAQRSPFVCAFITCHTSQGRLHHSLFFDSTC